MKTILSIAALAMLLAGTPSAPNNNVAYTIEYQPARDSASARAVVDVTYDAPAGRTVFVVPSHWADQSELYKAIDGLTLVSPGRLDTDSIADGSISVTTATRNEIHLRYNIHQDWNGPIARAHYFRTIIQPSFFLLLGHNALIIPRTSQPFHATMHWRVPSGDVVATSWGGGSEQHVVATINELREAVYAGGAMRAAHTTAGNSQLTLLWSDAKWPFPPEDLMKRAAAIVNAERTFWREGSKASYLVTLLPSVNDEGGTRYQHAMTLFVDPKYELAQYTPLIAHESFHEWLGQRIPQPDGDREMLMKWFAEGFTDYYGDRIAYEAGLMSADDYAGRINDTMRRYYLSPARDATRERIVKEYWTNTDVNRISYERGRLFAVRLNHEIRNATNNTKSIDDLLRVIMKLVPDSAELSDTIVAHAGERIAKGVVGEEIDSYINKGRVIGLSSDVLGPCFVMDSATIPVFDLGFDFAASRTSKHVTGVAQSSSAYAAGMRDGMDLKGMSFYTNDATKDATFRVSDANGERAISYRPVRADSARIPAFKTRACN